MQMRYNWFQNILTFLILLKHKTISKLTSFNEIGSESVSFQGLSWHRMYLPIKFWWANTSCAMTKSFSYFYCPNLILLPNLMYLLLILASLTIESAFWSVTWQLDLILEINKQSFSSLCVHFSDLINFKSLFWGAVNIFSLQFAFNGLPTQEKSFENGICSN